MFKQIVTPRFSETDALGHIGNTALPVWLEGARQPIFRIFSPELNLKKWPLILAKTEINFLGQLYYGSDVEIRTFIGKLGKSSFEVHQELWQNNSKCGLGIATMVCFDFDTQKSRPISDAERQKLSMHLDANN